MPIILHMHFYGSLNTFLPPEKRDRVFEYSTKTQRSVKDLVESIGIPHTEINLILIDNQSVDFNTLIKNSSKVDVYPAGVLPDNSTTIKKLYYCQPQITHPVRFVLDSHLGKLARELRMLGFDCLYRNDYDDAELADISSNKSRVLLTSDRKLLMRKQIELGYYVRSRAPQEQLAEILSRYELHNQIKAFTRCMRCNGLLQPAEKEKIESHLQPETIKHYEEFYQCKSCGKVYWKGSHYDNMTRKISKLC